MLGVCVCVMCAQAGFVSDRQSPRPAVSPSHPINSLEQLIGAILLDPKAGLFSKANSSFSVLPLCRGVIGPHVLQRAAGVIELTGLGELETGDSRLGLPPSGNLVVSISA